MNYSEYKVDQEYQFNCLKMVCAEKDLNKYKNENPRIIETMWRIIASENYSAEKAYELSKYGEGIIDIIISLQM